MTDDQDHYEAYYADKLWNLLPAVYRAQDTDQFGSNGPLRELVNRIGAQAAVLRRGLDRLWEDQSIETCDDWVIPYLGDLLATNLVANLDVRGQRLDVARTISYRRRKGTVAVLEEIAADVTRWDARVVEFFRCLGRTRHGLDPSLGQPAVGNGVAGLRRSEGLAGPLTLSPAGGLADLRHVYGASRAGSAFDEFFHTADFRLGRGRVGWHDIPRLGVFLWRLRSYGVPATTPVAVHGCDGWYTFDPTGRDVPLFAAAARSPDSYGDNWVSPVEGQLPTPISQPLYDIQLPVASPPADRTDPTDPTDPPVSLYPHSLAVLSNGEPLDPGLLTVRPERGRVHVRTAVASPVVRYYHGFSSEIGAGPYDRRPGRTAPLTPGPASSRSGGGAKALVAGVVPQTGTVTLTDSLTYTFAADVTVQGPLTLRAGPMQRPVLRPSATGPKWPQWRFTGLPAPGGSPATSLVLDGLFLSSVDVVLSGTFDSVTLTCCTLDPGGAAPLPKPGSSPPTSLFDVAADGQGLVPCHLWIEGTVGTLTVERCITGPIRTRTNPTPGQPGGLVETLNVSDGIAQAIPTSAGGPLQVADVKDPAGLQKRLRTGADPVTVYLRRLAPALGGALPTLQSLLDKLNVLLAGPSLYDPVAFQGVPLSAATRRLLTLGVQPPAPAPDLNRLLFEEAYPRELADAALSLSDGDVNLSGCTVLGRVAVHRLQASECILADLAWAEDTQHSCLRFSAWTDGSLLPRQYESVRIGERAELFASTRFGRPDYGQLLPTADAAIPPAAGPAPPTRPTIAAGARDGAEMGAFRRERNALNERALLAKLREFMPAGLVPVLVYVT
jgi:hypothetical protein